MLRFLTEHGFANIAPLGGWYAYSGGPLSATLGILQEFVAGASDGWELALDEIADAPERVPRPARSARRGDGQMHTALAPIRPIRRSLPRRRASSRSGC